MPNLVTITVRVDNQAAAALAAIGPEAAAQGDTAGKGWSSAFGSAMTSGLKNVASSGGIAAGLASLVAMSGPLAAAGLAVGGFTALALPSLDKVKNALTETGKQGQQAWAQLDPSQRNMAQSIQSLEKTFDSAAKAAEPLVASVVSLTAKVGSDLIPVISKLAPAGATVISDFLTPLDVMLRSPMFDKLITQMSQLALQVAPVLGQSLVKLIAAFLQLFVQVGPAGVQLLQLILPLIADMVTSLAPVVTWFAKATAAVVGFLDKNNLLMPVLAAVGILIALLAGGLPGAIAGLLGVGAIIGTKWKAIWDEVPAPVRDAVDQVAGFLRNAWDTVSKDISEHWTGIKQLLKGIWDVITGSAKLEFDAIVTYFKVVWDEISGVFKVGGDLVSGNWSKAWTDAKSSSDGVWGAIKNGASKLGGDLSGIWGSISKDGASLWKTIGNDVLKPVQDAYNSIAGPISASFDAWWKTHGAALEQVWNTVWTAISTTAKTVWSNIVTIITDAFNIIEPLFKAAIAVLEGAWKTLWDAVSAAAKVAWAAIQALLKIAWDTIVAAFNIFLDLITGHWKTAWTDAQAYVQQVWNAIKGFLSTTWNALNALAGQVWNNIKSTITKVADDLKASLEAAWNAMFAAIKSTWNDVASFFSGIAAKIKGYFTGATSWLVQAGKDVISGLLNGIKSALSGIASWVSSNIVDPIINAVKSFFGIHSPSTVMAEIGGHLVNGLIKGLITSGSGLTSLVGKVFGDMPHALLHLLQKGIGGITSLPSKAIDALKGLGSSALGVLKDVGGIATSIWDSIFGGGAAIEGYIPSAGVSQWKAIVDQALKLNGLPTSLDTQVLFQMQTESGGNPQAINLTDSNAAAGDPSRGLLQVIGSTFSAYHVAGTSSNIYDPLANVAAAINYAKHVYGPTLMSNGGGLGSGHGYAAGGVTSAGWAMVGEHGRELVKMPGGATVYPAGQTAGMLADGSGGAVTLEVAPGGDSAFEQFMVTAIRNWVRVKGGRGSSSVQQAFGQG